MRVRTLASGLAYADGHSISRYTTALGVSKTVSGRYQSRPSGVSLTMEGAADSLVGTPYKIGTVTIMMLS